jgi:hypothetical protein
MFSHRWKSGGGAATHHDHGHLQAPSPNAPPALPARAEGTLWPRILQIAPAWPSMVPPINFYPMGLRQLTCLTQHAHVKTGLDDASFRRRHRELGIQCP